jgi:uncharacterized membrane protein
LIGKTQNSSFAAFKVLFSDKSINITAINPLFMVALFGTAAACIFLAVSSVLKWHQHGAAYLLVGSLLYLIGTVGVTLVFNVPLNDALAIARSAVPKGRSPNRTAHRVQTYGLNT